MSEQPIGTRISKCSSDYFLNVELNLEVEAKQLVT